ncbi:unnamed protein product [Ectocarpus sp. 12 AP-2014]
MSSGQARVLSYVRASKLAHCCCDIVVGWSLSETGHGDGVTSSTVSARTSKQAHTNWNHGTCCLKLGGRGYPMSTRRRSIQPKPSGGGSIYELPGRESSRALVPTRREDGR